MRKINSLKNFLTSVIPYFILAILGFVRIKVFVTYLGIEINALNSLFSQIFNYISLVEAGVGTLITQMYYRLMIDKHEDEINQVFTSSVRMLRKVSLAIFAMGIGVSFLLGYLTNNTLSLGYMQFVFIIYLFRAITEYLMLSPRFVLQADQKIYKINVWINFYRIVEAALEIVWLMLGGDYVVILLSSIVIRVLSYWFTNRKVFREYPWLHYDRDAVSVPIKGMKNVFFHKVSGTVYENTDILLISSFLQPLYVTIYTAYNTIVKFIQDLIILLSGAITASFGNVMYKDSAEQKRETFEEMNMIFFYSATVFVACLFYATNHFVSSIWMGKQFLMDEIGFVLMIALLFHNVSRRPLLMIKDVCALFKETQVIAIVEAISNLILSCILVNFMGLNGVLLATVIATLISNFWFYPIYMYRNIFESSVIPYFIRYAMIAGFTILISVLGSALMPFAGDAGLISWVMQCMIFGICTVVFTTIFFYACFAPFRTVVKQAAAMLKTMMKRGQSHA